MASYPPKKNAAFNSYAVIRDADGDPIADPAGLSAVLSKDGGAQAAAANIPAVVSAGSKIVKLAMTAAEMNANEIAVVVSSTSVGAKDAFQVLYTSVRQVDDLSTITLTATEVADEVLKRGASNVEATADTYSLATIILAALESQRAGTTWTIFRTDGTTTHITRSITTNAAAELVTKVE